MSENAKAQQAGARAQGFLGSLKEALAAAGREELVQVPAAPKPQSASVAIVALPPPLVPHAETAGAGAAAIIVNESIAAASSPSPSAEEAARAVRATLALKPKERHVEFDQPPTTRVVRKPAEIGEKAEEPSRTQLVRGRQKLVRNDFAQDPVVAWLVVVGGPGLGAFRPIFEGNNTIGRAKTQRVSIDFGDDAISSEEQAYIRYDSTDRSFLFVPNLAKTNVVSLNDKRPTGAVELAHMDVITMGRTQLVFVPFCGPDFDWAELAEVKD